MNLCSTMADSRLQAPPDHSSDRPFRIAFAAVTLMAAVALLAGCERRAPAADTGAAPPQPVAAPAATPEASAAIPAAWLGQWNGPEGTFLRIEAGDPGRYTVTVQNLDGPRRFEGTAEAGALRFERDGVRETVQATDGAATGMKWLAEKKHCLTVRSGEGYCRD